MRGYIWLPASGRVLRHALIVGMATYTPAVHAAPTGPQVSAGSATVATAPNRTTIVQSSKAAVINWQSFSTALGEQVVIQQPNATAALLNRVTGANPSTLLGSLTANGQVYLINPNGVVVGPGAHIDAGAFFASTAQIGDSAFMAGGGLTFSGGTDASIVNLGVIKTTTGDAVLVGRRVDNEGKIDAPNGTAALIAATAFTYTPGNGAPVTVAAGTSKDSGGVGVNNAGRINAANAQLMAADGNLYGLAVNQTGVVKATGVKVTDGRILLTADGGTVSDSGTLSAHRADGSGGTIVVGGTHQGADPAVPNATTTIVTSKAVLNVAAKGAKANGGDVVVWSAQQTNFAGTIKGQGGAQGGNGGNAEVSSAHTLNYTGTADLRAAHGATGTLLLDPDAAIISNTPDDQANGAFNAGILAAALATANVTIDTSTGYGDGNTKFGDIVVNNAVTWTSGNTLTLKAGDNISVNANLTGGTGSQIVFSLGLGSNTNVSYLTTGNLTVASNATVHAGTVTIMENDDAAPLGAGNPPPNSLRTIGTVAFNGILQAGTLDLQLNDAGTNANVTIANNANTIGTLASSVAAGSVGGTLNIVNGSGNMSVTGVFANGGGQVDIQSAGNLTLANGAGISTNNNSGADIHLIAGGAFTNNAGASAVAINGAGRYLIYSDAPATTTLGGLAATPVYNKTFAANAPATIAQTGNRVLYSLAPTITFTADNQTIGYGSSVPTLTYTMTGLVGSDTAAQAFSGTPNIATAATGTPNAGNYAITAAAGSIVASDYNYRIAYANGSLTVNTAPLTITVANAGKTYGDPNPTFSATPSALVLGQTLSQLGTLSLSSLATQLSNVGNYAISGQLTNPTALANNYSVNIVPGTLTVSQRAVTVTASDTNRHYGDSNPTFGVTYSGTNPSGYTIAQLINPSGLSVSTTATSSSNVGGYTLTPSGITDPNFNVTYAPGTLTVQQRPLTITVNDAIRYYGDANPSFLATYSGLASFDMSSAITGVTLTTTATPSTAVGQVPIVAANGTNSNYAITYAPGTLTVRQRPLTITANDANRYYGDANPTFSATFSGLASFDMSSAIAGLTLTTTATPSTAAGQAQIVAANGTNSNYAITYAPGTLTIARAPLNFTVGALTAAYGQAYPSAGSLSVTGLKLSQSESVLGATLTGVGAQANVGTYNVGVAIGNSNYTVASGSGTLQITPAPLTIVAGGISRFYGDANPGTSQVPLTVTGLAYGQQALAELALTYGTNSIQASAGSYGITPSLLNGNYSIASSTPGTLTVLPRPIVIKPANVIEYYGDTTPAYSILVAGNGLASFDSISAVASQTQVAFNGTTTPIGNVFGPRLNAGQNSIAAVLTNNPNYAVINVPGVFAVLPRPATLTVANVTTTDGQTVPAFTATASNLASGDTVATAAPGLTLTTASQATIVTPTAYTPATYPLPTGYLSNSDFQTAYLVQLLNPTGTVPVFTPGPALPLALTSHAIPSTGVTSSTTVSAIGSLSAGSTTPQPKVSEIVPANFTGNSNYIFTSVSPGKLTINPTAAAIAAAQQAAAAALAAANKALFYNPPGGTGVFGLPLAALPSLFNAIQIQIANELAGGGNGVSLLSQTIETALGHPAGTKMTDADLYAYLATLYTSPQAQAVIGKVLSNYITLLASLPASSYSASDKALATFVDTKMATAKTQMATAALANQAAWVAQQQASNSQFNMTNLFGQSVPYGQFISDAAKTVTANAVDTRTAGSSTQIAGLVGTAVAAGATAAAGGALLATASATGALATVAPFGVAAVGGGATVLGTFSGPVGIVIVAVIGIGLEATQVANNAEQQKVFNTLTDPTSPAPTLGSLNLSTKKGTAEAKNTAIVDSAVLSTAIASILTW